MSGCAHSRCHCPPNDKTAASDKAVATACDFMALKDDIQSKQTELAATKPKAAPTHPTPPKLALGADEAMSTANRPGEAAFVLFHLRPDKCVGFPTYQLTRLELLSHQPDIADDPTRPAQTLTIGVPGADFVIMGNRLELIVEALAESRLKTVRAIPARYAELNPKQPYIAKIEVKAINQGEET